MTNRIPLIVNAGAGQIQEVSSTDVLQVPGNLTANVVQTDNYQYANGTPLNFGGTYGNSNVAAYLPTYTGNLTAINYILADTIAANANVVANNIISTTETVSGNLRAGNLSAVGNVVATGVKTDNYMYANGSPFVSSNYGDSNVQTLLNSGAFTGDIIPSGNATQSLGSNTNQWLDLWVSNATIYLNSIPLGVSGNGVLQFDGNDLVTSGPNVINTGNVETTGDVVGGNLVITAGGELTFADGSTQTSAYGNANVEAYLPSSATIVSINSNVSNTDSNVANLTTDLTNTNSELSNVSNAVITLSQATTDAFANTNSNVANLTTDLANTNSNIGNLTITVGDQANAIANLQGATYANANVDAYLPIYTGNIAGDIITANILVGEGGNISNITGANVTGEVALANTVSNPSQPNITALGTITSLTANAINVNGLFTANGNAQFNQDVYFAGNVTLPGNINQISGNSGQFFGNAVTGFGALYAGLPAGYTLLNNEVVQFSDSYDGYTQVSHRNINSGAQATTDFVATADNGDDFTNYIDLGVAGSGYDGLLANNSLGTSLYPNDGYLYAQGNVTGGNLVLGSNQANGVVRIIANGASNVSDVVATFDATGLSANGIVSATGNVTGGNIRTAGLISATGNVTTGNVNTAIVSATGTVQAGNLRTTGLISATGNATAGNVITAGRVSATGNVYGGNVFAIAPAGASFNVGDYFSNGTIVTLDYIGIGQASFPVGSTITITDGVEVPGLDGTYVVTAASADQCSFLNNVVASTANVPTGFSNTFPTVTGVNSAVVSTTGNVVFGGYAVGDGSLLTNLPTQPGTYTNSNVATFLSAFGSNSISTTGNITVNVASVVGNIITPQGMFAEGNIYTESWLVANNMGVDAYQLNVTTDANITGNITGSYFIGNGSLLTGLPAGYSDSNVVTLLASFGSNTISTTGNVTSGNFVTTGTAGTGNISGVNYITANYLIGDGSMLTNLPTNAPVIESITSAATITPAALDTQYNVTALAEAASFAAPSGTPLDGQKLTIRIIDDGTPRALSWDPIYTVIGTTLPTTTVANKYVYIGCIYNGQESTWDVVSVAQQA